MKRRLFLLLVTSVAGLALALIASWARGPARYMGPAFVQGDARKGDHLVGRYQCSRCHAGIVAGTAEVPLERKRTPEDCDDCHTQMATAPLAHAPPHYQNIPSLRGAGQLFRPEWLASFLTQPHDLRPHLDETMPHLGITPDEAVHIVALLMEAEPQETTLPSPAMRFREDFGIWDAGVPDRGKALYREKGCFACHTFTGAPVPHLKLRADRPDVQRAPDLRHTRERFRPDRIVDWLVSPKHHRPGTMMPDLDLTVQHARDLAAFIFDAPLGPPPAPPALSKRLPVLERPVVWNEVYVKVFSHTCIHCHGDPAIETADGGPGYAGGFGIRPRRLSFADYENTLTGALDDEGRPRSILEPMADGTPRLVAHLLARRHEVRGRDVEVRGMPLGLPPLTPEQIQLVESWVAQGAPRNLPMARAAVNIPAR